MISILTHFLILFDLFCSSLLSPRRSFGLTAREKNSPISAGATCDYRYSPTLFCATCLSALPPDHPLTRHARRILIFEKKKKMTNNGNDKKKNRTMRYNARNETDETNTTEGNDHIVGYGDAVRGRGLLRPGAVLSVPQKSPRAPGLRLPIRSTPQGGHRVTIGTCLKISTLSSCGRIPILRMLERNLGCTEALTLFFLLSLFHPHTRLFLFCVCVTCPVSLSVYLLVSLLNPPPSPLVLYDFCFGIGREAINELYLIRDS